MKSRRFLVALIGASALTVTACTADGNGGADSGQLVDGKTFTLALGTDPGSLDPTMTVLFASRNVGRFLYARLVNVQDDGKVVAGLAEKWEADTMKATFTLRDGITCDNGDPLKATDVADNLNFIADPKNRSPLVGVSVQPGSTATGDNDSRTVTVASGAPDAFLLNNLGTTPVVCGYGLKDHDLLAEGKAGTGMFSVGEIVPNDHYTLVRRKDYTWGPGDWDTDQKGLPDKVVVRIVPNETTAANLLLSGEVNATPVLGPEQKRLLDQDLFHDDIDLAIGQLHFNQAKGRPTADESVRRALVQAQDLPELRKVLTGSKDNAPKTLSVAAPIVCPDGDVSDDVPDLDVDAAKAALDDAGWKVGTDGIRGKDGKKLKLTMVYVTSLGETVVAGAELAKQNWKEIGVDVKLKGVDNPGLGEVLFSTGDWDISGGPVGAALPSQLIPFFAGPNPPQGTNFAHVNNAEYAALVQKAVNKPGVEGCDDWTDAETALVKAVDVIPYANSTAPTFGKGSRFSVTEGLDPMSIRMYK